MVSKSGTTNYVKVTDPSLWAPYSRKPLTIVLYVLTAIGFFIAFILPVVGGPAWAPGDPASVDTWLGPMGSFNRTLYGYFRTLPWYLPQIALMGLYTASQPRWLAPRGQYVEGQKYTVWSTYRLTAIAMTSALFAGAGIFRPEIFDLCALPAAIGAIYYDPIVDFFDLWLGGIIRGAVFLGGDIFARVFGGGTGDGGNWMFDSWVYWRYVGNPDSKLYVKNRWIRNLVWNIPILTVWRQKTILIVWWMYAPEAVPGQFASIIRFTPASVASAIVGFAVAEYFLDLALQRQARTERMVKERQGVQPK